MDANLHSKTELEHAVTSYQCVLCRQMWTHVKWSRCVWRCLHISVCLNMVKYNPLFTQHTRLPLFLSMSLSHIVRSYRSYTNSTFLSLLSVLQGPCLSHKFVFLEITRALTFTHMHEKTHIFTHNTKMTDPCQAFIDATSVHCIYF